MWERGLMSVYFYFPLNFTHCWVSLLTDCLWWCWRSTNTAEEAVTPPHCSISPRRTSTYLISWCEAHSHPSVRMCDLPPTWECVCPWCTYQVVAAGKTVCMQHPCVCERDEKRAILHALWRLLAPLSPMCAQPSNQYSFTLFCLKFSSFLDFYTENHQWREI